VRDPQRQTGWAGVRRRYAVQDGATAVEVGRRLGVSKQAAGKLISAPSR
jgi:hypothetical protein